MTIKDTRLGAGSSPQPARATPRACLWPGWSLPQCIEVVLFDAPLYLVGYAARGAVLLIVIGFARTRDLKAGAFGMSLVTRGSVLAVFGAVLRACYLLHLLRNACGRGTCLFLDRMVAA
jgi:hypothetical protein